MTKYMHSNKHQTNDTLYKLENIIVTLTSYDKYYFKLLSSFVYHSGREIDDGFMFWSGEGADIADYNKLMFLMAEHFDLGSKVVQDKLDYTRIFGAFLRAMERELSTVTEERREEGNLPKVLKGKENVMLTFPKSQKDSNLNVLIDVLNDNSKGMGTEAIKEITDVLSSLNNGEKSSNDYSKNMTFIKACAELSFGVGDPTDNTDMDEVLASLNATHYGMDEAKDLVVEYMGVHALNKEASSPQFIFTGPAGTGKTTLALQIAKALGRKAARVSLGGVRDEATLRGHGRTYLGSKCGRIMNAIMKTGTSNPVIVLDEIDKMSDMGSADSVLLEVLDPAQNVGFTDSYFNFSYDLSNVIFIATANYPERIDAPLKDRMEVIECSGYTLQEKVKIAQKYVIPNVMKEFGLKEGQIKISSATIKYIVNGWTREAGMRSLEQAMAKIFRGAVLQVLKGKKSVSVTKKYVEKRLGRIIWEDEYEIDTSKPGTVNGLAVMGGYTGCVIQIESAYSHTKGQRMLGDTGEMMNNSCSVVAEYLANNAMRYGVDASILDTVGICTLLGTISTPSDGDSASITLATSWVSLLLDRPVNPKTAMTGSISLNGKVRAIGGLDHKVAAGVRSGIETFIISRENENDYNDLSDDLKNAADFHIVDHIDDVMFWALDIHAVSLEEWEAAYDKKNAEEDVAY